MKTKPAFLYLAITICINIHTIPYAQAVSAHDSLMLIDLYKNTNGHYWHNSENWLTGPVSTWYGITVVDTSVTVINLE